MIILASLGLLLLLLSPMHFLVANNMGVRIAKTKYGHELHRLSVITLFAFLVFSFLMLVLAYSMTKGELWFSIPLFIASFNPWLFLLVVWIPTFYSVSFSTVMCAMVVYLFLLWAVEFITFAFVIKTIEGRAIDKREAFSLVSTWIIAFVLPILFLSPLLRKPAQD